MRRSVASYIAPPVVAALVVACGGANDAGGSSGTGTDGLYPSRIGVPSGMRTAPFDVSRSVNLPAGWTIAVWSRVAGARVEAWTPDRRLLVSRPGYGDVVELTPRTDAVPVRTTLVSGLRQPHGLAFDGSTLYVAESNQIDSYTYRSGVVSNRRVIISGLPDSKSPQLHGAYAHALKSLVVGRDGALYISVGSSANISADDRSADPPRAVILRWSPTTRKTTVFARGVRNGTAMGLDPTGALWTAVNNRDRMPYPFHRSYTGSGASDYGKVIQSYVNDHPPEPVAKVTAGRDLGWPYCDADPDVEPGVKGSPLSYSDRPFVDDPDTNPDGTVFDCAKLPRIEQGLPAHSAPLGLTFTRLPAPYGVGAIVTGHGSWNRTPPRAPAVTFFAWRHGTLADFVPLITGFQNSDGSRWGRTVDTVVGPDHALYLSDDESGTIYRITT